MTKRYDVIDKEEPRGQSVIKDGVPCTARHCCTVLNRLTEENEQLKRVIAENEKLIQSTYDELTKLRCIKKNLGRIKAQWDWIMEAIQYD